jgi:hypothetical protein
MVLPYLKGFVYILVFIIGEWFGLFLVISEVYFIILYLLTISNKNTFQTFII